jgi:uncharacterized protein (DUF2147 family)
MARCLRPTSRIGSSPGKLKGRFLPQISDMATVMKPILAKAAVILLAFSTPIAASAQSTLAGRWANPRHSVIVNVSRCGDAYCGIVSWATAKNRDRGTTPGTQVLSGLRPTGDDGVYEGRAFEPKRQMHGSATVRQVSPNVMIVKGCAIMGLFCKEQRWTRVS